MADGSRRWETDRSRGAATAVPASGRWRPAGSCAAPDARRNTSARSRSRPSASEEAPVLVWDIYGKQAGPGKDKLTTDDAKRIWDDLGDKNPAIAFQMIRRLIGSPEVAIDVLKPKLAPAKKQADTKQIARWI